MTTNATEPKPTSLAEALALLQQRLPRISKDRTAKVKSQSTGAQYEYKYSNLAAISAEVLPLLGELGLSFSARPTIVEGRFVLVYTLRHTSGQEDGGVYPLSERGTPQQIGGEITYARRYALCAITGVAPDDDDDDAAAAERAAAQRDRRGSRGRRTGDGSAEPGMTGTQQAQMQRLFTEVGMTAKADKLRYAIEAIGGREITSSTQLTEREAAVVLDRLQTLATAKKEEAERTADVGA